MACPVKEHLLGRGLLEFARSLAITNPWHPDGIDSGCFSLLTSLLFEEHPDQPEFLYQRPRESLHHVRSSNLEDKRAIRACLHPQLSELGKLHRVLTNLTLQAIPTIDSGGQEVYKSRLDELADKYTHLDRGFVPLINQHYGLSCTLDILLLRREQPGRVVMQSGDIDNRIKTLFDGLRMPNTRRSGACKQDRRRRCCVCHRN